jgi:hypothetical protein
MQEATRLLKECSQSLRSAVIRPGGGTARGEDELWFRRELNSFSSAACEFLDDVTMAFEVNGIRVIRSRPDFAPLSGALLGLHSKVDDPVGDSAPPPAVLLGECTAELCAAREAGENREIDRKGLKPLKFFVAAISEFAIQADAYCIFPRLNRPLISSSYSSRYRPPYDDIEWRARQLRETLVNNMRSTDAAILTTLRQYEY